MGNGLNEQIDRHTIRNCIKSNEDCKFSKKDDCKDKFISIIQFAMSILVFIGIAVWGICHICMGNLKGFGLFGICFLLFLAWQLILKTWSEYQQEKNK